MYPLDCNKPITIQCVYAMSCLEICCVRQTWFETLKPFVPNCSKHTTFKCISAIKQSRLKLLEWYFECILLQQNKASQAVGETVVVVVVVVLKKKFTITFVTQKYNHAFHLQCGRFQVDSATDAIFRRLNFSGDIYWNWSNAFSEIETLNEIAQN